MGLSCKTIIQIKIVGEKKKEKLMKVYMHLHTLVVIGENTNDNIAILAIQIHADNKQSNWFYDNVAYVII